MWIDSVCNSNIYKLLGQSETSLKFHYKEVKVLVDAVSMPWNGLSEDVSL